MVQKVFLKASPKAAAGIRRVYERKGADVTVNLADDGSLAVVVTMRDAVTGKGRRRGSTGHDLAAA